MIMNPLTVSFHSWPVTIIGSSLKELKILKDSRGQGAKGSSVMLKNYSWLDGLKWAIFRGYYVLPGLYVMLLERGVIWTQILLSGNFGHSVSALIEKV